MGHVARTGAGAGAELGTVMCELTELIVVILLRKLKYRQMKNKMQKRKLDPSSRLLS